MSATKPVNIDLLAEHAGTITAFGEEHRVLHLDGEAYRVLNTTDPQTASYTLAVYAIIERLVPTLGSRVDRLSAKQAGAILGVATGMIEAVEEQFPNGSGASSETVNPSTSPASP
jgi:hypothetical protein